MATVWDATAVTSFGTAAAVFGGLLVLGALLSGLDSAGATVKARAVRAEEAA
jgi:hypothetical protein